MIIWLTGLSGSGKTTIGRNVYAQWKTIEPNTVLIDGDEIRRIFDYGKDTSDAYSVQGRLIRSKRITGLCKWLDSQKVNAVCCTIANSEEIRQWNRANYSGYFEVYLSVPMEILIKRDKTNLYAPALRGECKNVVGLDIPFHPPANPDLIIKNDRETFNPQSLARDILIKAGIIKAQEEDITACA